MESLKQIFRYTHDKPFHPDEISTYEILDKLKNLDVIKERQKVGDIGCGAGRLFPGLSDIIGKYGEVIGVDISKYSLLGAAELLRIFSKKESELTNFDKRILEYFDPNSIFPANFLLKGKFFERRPIKNVELINSDGSHLPFKDDYFDVSLSFDVLLQILEIRNAKKLVSEMNRISKDGFIFTVYPPMYDAEKYFKNPNAAWNLDQLLCAFASLHLKITDILWLHQEELKKASFYDTRKKILDMDYLYKQAKKKASDKSELEEWVNRYWLDYGKMRLYTKKELESVLGAAGVEDYIIFPSFGGMCAANRYLVAAGNLSKKLKKVPENFFQAPTRYVEVLGIPSV